MLTEDIVNNLERISHEIFWGPLLLKEIKKTGDINICLQIPQDDIDQSGKNFLMLATQEDIHLESFKYLLDIGMDPNVQCIHYSETALMLSVEEYNLEAFDLLLEYGADPNLQDDLEGVTVLFDTVTGGYSDLTLKLLQQKANPNIQDKLGNTPLICAIIELNKYYQFPNIQLDDKLFMNNRLINRKSSGFPDLGYEEIIDLLLKYDANPHICNKDGLSALDYAREFNLEKIVEKFNEIKINPETTVETSKIDLSKQNVVSPNVKDNLNHTLINYSYFKVLVFDSKIHLVFFDNKDQIIIEFCDIDCSKIIEDSKKHITSIDHAIYLGQELTKAEICLKNGIEYNSDQQSHFILSRNK